MQYTFAFHLASFTSISACCCLLWFGGFYLILWLGSLAASLVCLLYVSYQAGSFLDNFLSRFRVKPTNKAVFITATKRMWDKIQRNWECCAVNGPGDYEMPASELPESCCKPGVDNCEEGKAYTTGCYKSLKEFVMQNYYAIIGVGVIIALIEITAAVMAFVMVRAIKNEKTAPI